MNLSTQTSVQANDRITMTSLDFLNTIINPARKAAGEKPVSNTHFLTRSLDELDLGGNKIFTIPHPQNNKPQSCIQLDTDQMLLIGMRESKAVRKSVLAKLKELETKQVQALPDFTNPVEAARAWADELEAKTKALSLAKAKEIESTDKSIATMTVTDIGLRLDMKATEVNQLLIDKGLQTRSYTSGVVSYHITPVGMPYAIKATSNNCKSSQLRWLSTVLSELGQLAN